MLIKRLKLGMKLNLILASVFIVFFGISGLVLSHVLQTTVEQTVTNNALTLIETMNSVRDYTREHIKPELASRLETEEQFLPQTVPGYSARTVFEYLRERDGYGNFAYKEATLNPTNPRDLADSFEAKIVNQFRQDSDLKNQSGFRALDEGNIFYVARPITISKESCLQCHSSPSIAPKSQITTYGSEGGFGWKLNEIVGTQIISVPAGTVLANARQLKLLVIGLVTAGFITAAICLNLFLSSAIIKPIKTMAKWARKVSTGDISSDYQHRSNDEVGTLAASIQRLKMSMEMAMNMIQNQPDNNPSAKVK